MDDEARLARRRRVRRPLPLPGCAGATFEMSGKKLSEA